MMRDGERHAYRARESRYAPDREVYAAGPITGLSYDEARHGWREALANMLPPHVHLRSPMRGKDALVGMTDLAGDSDGMRKFNVTIATPKGILARDTSDVRSADALVACLLGAERVSIGTMFEMGMAHALCKPTVLVMEKTGNAHEHAFVDEAAAYRVETLEEAATLLTHLLTPGC